MIGRLSIAVALLLFWSAATAAAAPGEYSLRAKLGPSFEIQDLDNSFKVAGEFDYELGYGLGFDLAAHLGFGSTVVVQLIPAFRYDVIYFVPGSLFVVAGAGWDFYDGEDSAMSLRFGLGLRLPLHKPFEFVTDVNYLVAPIGVAGTPMTFDWLTGLGMRF